MPSILKENLRFFSKSGADINATLDSNGIWSGLIKIDSTSVGLHEVSHIFILENVINSANIITRTAVTNSGSNLITFTNGTTQGLKPGMWISGTGIPTTATILSIKNVTQILLSEDATISGTTSVEMHSKRYDKTYPRSTDTQLKLRLGTQDDIFYIFDVDYQEASPILIKETSHTFTLDDGSGDSILFEHRNLAPSSIKKDAIQLNIAAMAAVEGSYANTIIIEEIESNGDITVLATFDIVYEAEGEDERFKSMLENFGKSIDINDYVAFRDTDIKEDKIDYRQLNSKRKEMLISGNDIWPYLGSYKGLVNALNYFGYGDLRLKEYWLNVSQTSKNEGKLITMDVPLSLNYTDKELKDYQTFIGNILPNSPSMVHRKTAKFALFYDINRETGEYDDDGLPITEDVFEFTNEEILVKLFSLKTILKEKFLPLNARIIDITGEGVYYDNIGINSWNIPTPTIHIDVNKDIDFSANPLVGFLKDLTSTTSNNCDITASTKLSDVSNDPVNKYAFCVISSDTVIDANGNVIEAPSRYSRKLGLPVTLTNLTNDYIWDELSATWGDAAEKNWDNFKYDDFQTIRWIIRSVAKNEIVFDKSGPIEDLETTEAILPYLGYYDVTLELVDHFNFPHRATKQNYLQVRPQEPDMVAVFRRHDRYQTWDDIENTDGDLALLEMHGTWMDATSGNDTTWEEAGDVTWESVDWMSYIDQDGMFDYLKDNMANMSNDRVGEIIGLMPSTHKIRVRGFNNNLLKNNKKQSAFFFKDTNTSNNVVLDIVSNASSNPDILRERNNNAIHFTTPLIGYLVGDYGKLLYTVDGGVTWLYDNSGTHNNLNHLYFTSTNNGWIVGEYGTVIHYTINPTNNFKTINVIDVNTTSNLRSVHFVEESIGYIAGDGIILKTTNGGQTWSNITPSGATSLQINSIYFPTVGVGIAVTNDGKIIRTVDSGLNWTITTYTTPFIMNTVFFIDKYTGWIGGQYSKILKTTDGGVTWLEYSIPMQGNPNVIEGSDFVPYSIKFADNLVGYASGSSGRIIKTIDGGLSWASLYNGPSILLGSIYPVDSLLLYVAGWNGNIYKSTDGGIIFNSQKSNQPTQFASGSNSDVWVTEPYGGKILQNERATLAIKHIPTSITWTSSNELETTWPLGSLQQALNASQIYFIFGSGYKQFSIKSASLSSSNVVAYTIHQMVYDTNDLDNAYTLEEYSGVYLDAEPKSDTGGVRIRWKNVWTNDSIDVISNMVIILRLDYDDYYCDVIDMDFDGDDTILQLDWKCDVVNKLDPDYKVVLKEYDIEIANNSLGTNNITWNTLQDTITWSDMDDKTWNDYEFNGISYCGYVINSVKRGGSILVDSEHFFQFPPEKIIELECDLVSGNGYVSTADTSSIEVGMLIDGVGIPPGSVVTFIDSPTVFIISIPPTQTITTNCSIVSPDMSLSEAVELLNSSDVPGINDFIYSIPLQSDGITYENFIVAKAKNPGAAALHYFEFLNGVESEWEDDPAHTHSYPLGFTREWTKSIADGGQPVGDNNPPLWNHLYSTYYEFGEWFPVNDKLGEYSEDITSTRSLYTQALDGTFNWQDTSIKRWKVKVTPGTTVFISSYPSKIIGIKDHAWKLYDSITGDLLASAQHPFMIWTFCNPGSYTVKLECTDIEGNEYNVTRKGWIVVESFNTPNKSLPGLGWIPQEDVPMNPNTKIPDVVAPDVEESDDLEPQIPEPPVVPTPEPAIKISPLSIIYNNVNSMYEDVFLVGWQSKHGKDMSLIAKEFYLDYEINGIPTTTKFDILKATEVDPNLQPNVDTSLQVQWSIAVGESSRYQNIIRQYGFSNVYIKPATTGV